ncbi:GYF domain-containing protein [Roseiconus lacunae]|uniref:GYF domain-containing protein n=1 Tax=Roseiconus lacunae TaxID=2605694 RepID=UPI0030937D80|nr:GYF domain-containing protein [Stieleria sp. HD01]
MGIRFACHACGKPLNIKNELAGRRGVCPKCKERFRIPESDAKISLPLEEQHQAVHEQDETRENRSAGLSEGVSTGQAYAGEQQSAVATLPRTQTAVKAAPTQAALSRPTPVPTAKPNSAKTKPNSQPPAPQPSVDNAPDILSGDDPATWYVRPPSGGQYGPAETSVLRDWIDEGRVAKSALLWRDGWPQWREAAEVLPEIAERLPGAVNVGQTGGAQSTAQGAALGKTKSIAAEKTSPLDPSLAGTAKIGAARRKRANQRMTLVAVLGALVVGLIVTLVLVASAGS